MGVMGRLKLVAFAEGVESSLFRQDRYCSGSVDGAVRRGVLGPVLLVSIMLGPVLSVSIVRFQPGLKVVMLFIVISARIDINAFEIHEKHFEIVAGCAFAGCLGVSTPGFLFLPPLIYRVLGRPASLFSANETFLAFLESLLVLSSAVAAIPVAAAISVAVPVAVPVAVAVSVAVLVIAVPVAIAVISSVGPELIGFYAIQAVIISHVLVRLSAS